MHVQTLDSVVVLVFNRDGQILVQRRGAAMRYSANQLAFPGGGVDPGHTPRSACMQELRQECSLTPCHMLAAPERLALISKRAIGWTSSAGFVHLYAVYLHRLPRGGIRAQDANGFEVNAQWGARGYAWCAVDDVRRMAGDSYAQFSGYAASVFNQYVRCVLEHDPNHMHVTRATLAALRSRPAA